MRTPPRVTADDATAALQRIRQRRVKVDDPRVHLLSDDVVETLAYLRKYSRGGIPSWVRVADVQDGLILRVRLFWLGLEAELWLLEAARREGVPAQEVSRRLQLNSRQGPRDRIKAAREKLALLRGEPVHERRPGQDQPEHDPEATWLEENREVVLRIAAAVEKYHDLGNSDAQEWLVEVARDLRDRAVTPGSFMTVRFAASELAVSSAVLDSPPDHPVREALHRWSELYDSYVRTLRQPR